MTIYVDCSVYMDIANYNSIYTNGTSTSRTNHQYLSKLKVFINTRSIVHQCLRYINKYIYIYIYRHIYVYIYIHIYIYIFNYIYIYINNLYIYTYIIRLVCLTIDLSFDIAMFGINRLFH